MLTFQDTCDFGKPTITAALKAAFASGYITLTSIISMKKTRSKTFKRFLFRKPSSLSAFPVARAVFECKSESEMLLTLRRERRYKARFYHYQYLMRTLFGPPVRAEPQKRMPQNAGSRHVYNLTSTQWNL